MSKKKFSLGAILQKLNEDNSSEIDSTVSKKLDSSLHDSNNTHQPDSPNTPADLPQQPVISPTVQHLNHSKHKQIVQNNDNLANQTKINQPIILERAPTPAPLPGNAIHTPANKMFEEEDEEEFDILKYLAVIVRRKNIVIITVILMTLFSIYKFLSADHYYIANARLLFRPGEQEMIGDANFYRYFVDREKTFSTHLELLKSHTVLSIVSQNLENKIPEGTIKSQLTIKQGETDGSKTDIIELNFKYRNADTARDLLNELCRTYIDYRREVNAQELTRFIFKFETQINKLQNELDAKENDLRRFKEENQMVQLSSEANLTITKLSEMELALQKTNMDLLESKERLTALNSQINQQDLDIVQSITYQDPLQTKIADLELELNSSTAEYNEEHYKVKTLKQQIENLKAAAIDSISREAASKTLVKNPIRQSLLQELINLTIEKSALEAKRIAQEQIIDKLNKDLMKLPFIEQRFANLQRETESQIQTLRLLKTKYEEAKIKRDSQESDLKLLELARTPTIAISNVKLSSIIIGIMIGFILGVALLFIIEYLDQSLKDPADVEKELELPLLGIVPLIEAEQALIEQSTDLTKTILEPFRALRANLKHIASAHHDMKTFMVCSAVKGEGKTTLSANLAITFALDGKSVILIDADLRRSQIHSLFNIPKQTGVSDYLIGTATVDQIIKPTRYPNLSVITSGERPHNPAELLGTIRFDLLIEELRSKAEIIIFDSPALLPVSDTITMAPKMDCCVVIVRTFWTPLKAAKQAKNQLKRIGCKLYGGILNGVSHGKNYYPYYYGYYGYYSYKYTYDEDQHDSGFSLRKFGLRVENSLKEKINDIRFNLPKYISTLGSYSRFIMSRKRFWILFFLLLTITGLRIWYQSRYNEPVDSIQYLGLGASEDNSDSVSINSFQDIASPASNRSKNEQFLTEKPVLVDNFSLVDSINIWIKAKSDRNISRFLSFYDSSRFIFPKGSFTQWTEDIKQQFSINHENSIFTLLNSSNSLKDSIHQEITLNLMEFSAKDTLFHTVTFIWRYGINGWRIIREKSTIKQQTF